jgi:hypothetical protein
MAIISAPLLPADRARWDVLACGYKPFYSRPTTEKEYDDARRRPLESAS